MPASLSFSTAPPPWATDAQAVAQASDGLPNVGSPVRRQRAPAEDVGASVTGREVAHHVRGTPPGHGVERDDPRQGRGPSSVAALLDGITSLKADAHAGLASSPPPPPPPDVSTAVDAPAAYAAGAAAGERAALARAFREALPCREALGALAAAVRMLDARAGTAEATSRSAGAGAAAALATAAATEARLAALEAGPLKDLQAAAAAAVPDRLSADFQATLAALTAAVDRPAGGVALARGARWVVGAVGGLVDAAGGTALSLSSRVLLDGGGGGGGAPSSSSSADAAARTRARALLGGGLFLASVELAWAAHRAALLRTPRPLAGGLRKVRQAGWAAALILGLGAVRSACFSAADAALGSALGGGGGGGVEGRPAGGEEEEAEEVEGGGL